MLRGTMIEYLKEFGHVTFMESPINEVDALILSQLAYLKFDHIVPGIEPAAKPISLGKMNKHPLRDGLFADERYRKENMALFSAMLDSKRFQKLRCTYYVNIWEKRWETQFSAITYLLEDKTVFVAFRGTDETIIGWKEDFNMAFVSPVPGQSLSVKYLNMVTALFSKRYYVGGHSKGGNLAVYSAMNASEEAQNRIIRIYDMDGPSFRPKVLEEGGYEKIADRVIKIVPHYSVVGMLFEQDLNYKVVDCKGFGIVQHDPYRWIVEKGKFVELEAVDAGGKLIDDTINQWLLNLSPEQLQIFVDTLFQIIAAAKAEQFSEFTKDLRTRIHNMADAFQGLDEETRAALRAVVKSMYIIMKEQLRKKRFLGRNETGNQEK